MGHRREERLGGKHLATQARDTSFYFLIKPLPPTPPQVNHSREGVTMEAIAKYDFTATAEDELSFKRGEVLKVSEVNPLPSRPVFI